MKALILIGGLVVVALVCIGVFYLATNVRIGSDRTPSPKNEQE